MIIFQSKGINIYAPLDEIAFLDRELRFMIPEAMTVIYSVPEYRSIIRPLLPDFNQITDKHHPWYFTNKPKNLFANLVYVLNKHAPFNYSFRTNKTEATPHVHWGYYANPPIKDQIKELINNYAKHK